MERNNLFNRHPKEVGMTYWQHLRFALCLCGTLLKAVIASMIHAFFPFWFVTYSSTSIIRLYGIFEKRSKKQSK